ncbi:MAG: antibiotic biosynthesis monooxygenase [Chloroflexi bacterium]|nr:antibiotic biosynthesis monooxygenase [Chloroflexota bacterium]
MVTIIARMKIREGKEEEALAKVTAMAEAVQANEPGALAYIVHRNQEDPSEIVFFELYADDAAFESHGQTAHMGAMRENFVEIFDPASLKIERLDRIAGEVRAG